MNYSSQRSLSDRCFVQKAGLSFINICVKTLSFSGARTEVKFIPVSDRRGAVAGLTVFGQFGHILFSHCFFSCSAGEAAFYC